MVFNLSTSYYLEDHDIYEEKVSMKRIFFINIKKTRLGMKTGPNN